MPNEQTAPDSKLQDFTEELNTLLEKYNYRLEPILNFDRKGITPGLNVANRTPVAEPVNNDPEPTPEVPEAPEEIAEPNTEEVAG